MNATFPCFLGAVAVVAVVLTASVEAGAPAGRYTTASGAVFDTKTKLTWQQTAPSGTYTWADAKTYCQNLSLAGTGWRLPTMKELQTIVDDSRLNPSIDPTAFPATLATYFWSSSPFAGQQTAAWFVDFGLSVGSTNTDDMTSTHDVRCVR
jgi:formylglycine-generating enzyme required for sulfatase activity